MGSCEADEVPDEAAGVAAPGVETCVMVVAAGPVPARALEPVVLLVHPAEKIIARQTMARKTRVFLFVI